MAIRNVDKESIRRMEGREGLVLTGCGGDLTEWLDGINATLEEAGILKNGSRFAEAVSFECDGQTCLLFPFEGVELDIGKLAIWRLRTHGAYGGTWLSDFIPNRLGDGLEETGGERGKPDCPLIGEDGNVFNLMGAASRALRENGMEKQAEEMASRILGSDSHAKALEIIGEYVDVTGPDAAHGGRLSVRERIKSLKREKTEARPDRAEHRNSR